MKFVAIALAISLSGFALAAPWPLPTTKRDAPKIRDYVWNSNPEGGEVDKRDSGWGGFAPEDGESDKRILDWDLSPEPGDDAKRDFVWQDAPEDPKDKKDIVWGKIPSEMSSVPK